MARAIDADELRNQIRHMLRTVNPDLVQYALVQAIIADMPTLTPPNEWVSRMREIEELHAKLRAVTGCSLEQIIEMFAAGYTLEKPDYSNETMDRLDETIPPNEPLTLEQLREMREPTPVWWDFVHGWVLAYKGLITSWNGIHHSVNELKGKFYRCPPEGEEDI